LDQGQAWLTYTPRTDVINTIDARYRANWDGEGAEPANTQRAISLTDNASAALYGQSKGEPRNLNYVQYPATAQDILLHQLRDVANPRLMAEIVGGLWLTRIERADVVVFADDDAAHYTRLFRGLVTANDRFLVIEQTRNGDYQINIKAVKLPPPAYGYGGDDTAGEGYGEEGYGGYL
jgi:hypothetical protein